METVQRPQRLKGRTDRILHVHRRSFSLAEWHSVLQTQNQHRQAGSPKLVKNVDPVYPPEATSEHISGTVRVDYVNGGDGAVYNAHAISGEGLSEDPSLRIAAEEAVIRTIRFSLFPTTPVFHRACDFSLFLKAPCNRIRANTLPSWYNGSSKVSLDQVKRRRSSRCGGVKGRHAVGVHPHDYQGCCGSRVPLRFASIFEGRVRHKTRI